MRLSLMTLPLLLAGCTEGNAPTGRQDFAVHCAGCHGPLGRGDGAAAAGLATRPADLTGLSARSGGVFPGTAVMAKIWGYAGGRDAASPMPAFGPLLEGARVPHDGGDGIATPTPVRLVQIAEHLRALQE